jgi:hypothetical protein
MLKLDEQTMRELVYDLHQMTKDCSVIEFVIMQSKRDRTLRPYLDEYNKRRAEFNKKIVFTCRCCFS